MKKLVPWMIFRPAVALAALLLILEEWLWARLSVMVAQLADLLKLRRLEAWISSLPPYAALVIFVLPSIVVLPAKLASLTLLAHGNVLASVSVFSGAKLLGTALVARAFKLTKPQLMTLPWFARLYALFTGWLVRAHAWFDANPTVIRTRAAVRRAKEWMVALVRKKQK